MTREALRRQGEAMRARLFPGEAGGQAGGLRDMMSEVAYGSIWSRPGLAMPERMICTLAALSAVQRLDQLRAHVGAALDLGLAAQAIVETFVQSGLYAGFGTTEASVAVASEVLAARGQPLPDDPRDEASLEELSARGDVLLDELHGDRGRQGYAAPDDPVTGALYPLAIRYGYGAIWSRPGLDRRRQALVAVAAFTALRLEGQVRKFGESALNAGLSRAEVIEAIVQTAPFSGFPPALNALAALREVLRPASGEL